MQGIKQQRNEVKTVTFNTALRNRRKNEVSTPSSVKTGSGMHRALKTLSSLVMLNFSSSPLNAYNCVYPSFTAAVPIKTHNSVKLKIQSYKSSSAKNS
jgi:hypothetical protein